MLPQIAKLNEFLVYRDGGSIGASFQGTDGDEYTLFFQRYKSATAELTTSFSSAILHRYTPTEYKSSITGVATPDWRKQDTELSWADARALLDRLAGYFEVHVTERADVYSQLVAAAMVDGKARPVGDDEAPPGKHDEVQI